MPSKSKGTLFGRHPPKVNFGLLNEGWDQFDQGRPCLRKETHYLPG